MNQIIENKETAVATQQPPLLSAINQVISQPEIDIDKIAKMIELQEKIESKENEKAFNLAFSIVQNEMPEIAESTQGHGYQYASLEHIQKEVKPILSKHGFSLTFDIANGDNSVTVTAWLRHKNGHKLSSTYTAPLDTSGSKKGNPIQAAGSTISYLQRYLTTTMLNITTHGVDDDAFKAGNFNPVYDDEFYLQQLRHLDTKKDCRNLYSSAKVNGASNEVLAEISKRGNEL